MAVVANDCISIKRSSRQTNSTTANASAISDWTKSDDTLVGYTFEVDLTLVKRVQRQKKVCPKRGVEKHLATLRKRAELWIECLLLMYSTTDNGLAAHFDKTYDYIRIFPLYQSVS